MNGTSRVTGDSQARFCERLGVKLPEPTRRPSAMMVPTATQAPKPHPMQISDGTIGTGDNDR